jgi:hypothetical protein
MSMHCVCYYFEVYICVTPVKIIQVHLQNQSFVINYIPVFGVMQQVNVCALYINNERIANVTLTMYKRPCNLKQGK